MNNNQYSYAVEKLTNTLTCLATHPGDARQRLACAYKRLFHTLQEHHFPPECQEKWRWVMRQLTKCGPLKDCTGKIHVGSVDNTMRRVRKNTGAKIAEAIYELYWAVSKNQRYF